MAAFDVVADDRTELAELFSGLSVEIERVMTGMPYEEREPAFPALYTGTVGNPPPPANLSVVVAVGSSLFDERFGLGNRKPATHADGISPTTDATRRTTRRCVVSIASEQATVHLRPTPPDASDRGGMTLR